jgi:hypothetical protein
MRKAGAATRTDCVLGAQFESSRPHHAVLRKRGFPGSVRIKIGGSSIWIRRRQAARPRDLRSGGCKDWRQMFHERGAEAAGSHEETRRIAANIAEAAEAVAQVLTPFHRVHAFVG